MIFINISWLPIQFCSELQIQILVKSYSKFRFCSHSVFIHFKKEYIFGSESVSSDGDSRRKQYFFMNILYKHECHIVSLFSRLVWQVFEPFFRDSLQSGSYLRELEGLGTDLTFVGIRLHSFEQCHWCREGIVSSFFMAVSVFRSKFSNSPDASSSTLASVLRLCVRSRHSKPHSGKYLEVFIAFMHCYLERWSLRASLCGFGVFHRLVHVGVRVCKAFHGLTSCTVTARHFTIVIMCFC